MALATAVTLMEWVSRLWTDWPAAPCEMTWVTAASLEKYDAEKASLVRADVERLHAWGLNTLERDLLAEEGVIRHDPDRLARAVFEMGTRWVGK